MIDLIVPVYNEPNEHLTRLLGLVISQDISNEIYITFIDDCSDEEYNYANIIDKFKNILNIQLLRLSKNSGSGVARQYGINHTSNELIIMADADDVFLPGFAISALKKGINQTNEKGFQYIACIRAFYEVHNNKNECRFGRHSEDTVWMHGKMYRRSYLKKYDIHFHESSRANEDMGFNTIVKLLSSDEEPINFIPTPIYYWLDNPTSITRRNDCTYAIDDEITSSYYGFIENKIFAINHVKKVAPYNYNIYPEINMSMIFIYERYMHSYLHHPEFCTKQYKYALWFYKEIFREYKDTVAVMIRFQSYDKVMNHKIHDKFPISIFDFIKQLEEDIN